MPNSTNSTFPQKLFILLENEKNDIITWLHHGLAFKVIEPDRFIEEVMPKYFRHTKMTSFQRQLNLYGFRRVNKGEDQGAYFHPKFQRKQKEMAIEIRRLPTKLSPFQNEADLSDIKFARPGYSSEFNTHEINRSLSSANEDSINIKGENLAVTDINYQFSNNIQENINGLNQIPRTGVIAPEARFTTGYGSGVSVSSTLNNPFSHATTTTTANSTVTTTKVLDDQLASNHFGCYSTPTTNTRSYSSSFSQPKIVEVDGIPADQFLNKLPKLLSDISSQLSWQNDQIDFNLFDEVSLGATNVETMFGSLHEIMKQDDLISKYINNEIDLTSNLLNHNKKDIMQNIMDFNSSSYSIISSIPASENSHEEDVLAFHDVDVDMTYLDSLFSIADESDFFQDTFSDSILV